MSKNKRGWAQLSFFACGILCLPAWQAHSAGGGAFEDPGQQRYVYNQEPATNKVFFPEERVRQFVGEFSRLYRSENGAPHTFVIRVNPGGPDQPQSLAERQSAQDLARYFGRPLREGGLKLLDDRSPDHKSDIALNIYISTREIRMTGFGGELVTKEIPELQAAAVRQSDGAILGQAGTADLIGDRQDSWVAVQRVGVPELFKATALILLEDMVRVRFKEAVAQVQRERPEVPGPPLEPAPPRLPGPEPEIAPLTAAEMALIDNLSLREKAAAYNASVAKLQKRSSEIHAWEHALIGGPPMAKPLPDAPMQMVKAAVKSKAQNL